MNTTAYSVRIKSIRLLFLSTIVILLIACGGSAGPDIEATVAARLAEERVAEATIEASLKKAITALPTPVPEVVIKEVPVEVVVTATYTPMPAATSIPTLTPTPTQIAKHTPTSTSTAEPLDGQIMVNYYYDVENPIYLETLAAFAKEQVLEVYADRLASALLLPKDLTLSLVECGMVNAFYYPDWREVVICVEWIEYATDVLTPFAADDAELADWGGGIFAYTMWHEIGHALIDIMDLPAVGREEDAVDQLAALILMESVGGLDAMDAVIGFFIVAGLNAEAMDQLAFWDEHSLDIQRAYDLACLMYGSDPIYAADYVELGFLPQERAQRCGEEYTTILTAWNTLLDPYFNTSTSTPTPTLTPTPKLAPAPTPTVVVREVVVTATPTPTATATATATPSPTGTPHVFTECLKWEGTPAIQVVKHNRNIPIQPGWNLISLPGTPSDTSVDTILAGATGITTVVTTNVLTANGMPCNAIQSPVTYTSDRLTRISNNKAYWVHSNTITSIKVNIPALTFATLPPTISVRTGWNLVPVISIGGAAIGSSISADTYFSSISWSQAKGYDASAGTFTTLFPSTGANLTVGQGYYVYTKSAGVIVP